MKGPHFIVALMSTSMLTACLGVAGEEESGFGELADASNAIQNLTFDSDVTELADIPLAGSASYDGFLNANAQLDNDDEEFVSVIGTSTMTVTFGGATGTISGSATNFVDADDAPIPGTLTYSGTYTNVDLSGTVTGELEVEAGTITATGDFDGEFRGSDARLIRADVFTGTITGADTGRWNALITGEQR